MSLLLDQSVQEGFAIAAIESSRWSCAPLVPAPVVAVHLVVASGVGLDGLLAVARAGLAAGQRGLQALGHGSAKGVGGINAPVLPEKRLRQARDACEELQRAVLEFVRGAKGVCVVEGRGSVKLRNRLTRKVAHAMPASIGKLKCSFCVGTGTRVG